MNTPSSFDAALLAGLDDLLSELRHARHQGELGRLALLAYCDLRSWARQAGEVDVAHRSSAIFTQHPHTSTDDFLAQVDDLIGDLVTMRCHYATAADTACSTL